MAKKATKSSRKKARKDYEKFVEAGETDGPVTQAEAGGPMSELMLVPVSQPLGLVPAGVAAMTAEADIKVTSDDLVALTVDTAKRKLDERRRELSRTLADITNRRTALFATLRRQAEERLGLAISESSDVTLPNVRLRQLVQAGRKFYELRNLLFFHAVEVADTVSDDGKGGKLEFTLTMASSPITDAQFPEGRAPRAGSYRGQPENAVSESYSLPLADLLGEDGENVLQQWKQFEQAEAEVMASLHDCAMKQSQLGELQRSARAAMTVTLLGRTAGGEQLTQGLLEMANRFVR